MQLRTDLAIERFAAFPHGEGVNRQDEQRGDIQVHRVQPCAVCPGRQVGQGGVIVCVIAYAVNRQHTAHHQQRHSHRQNAVQPVILFFAEFIT